MSRSDQPATLVTTRLVRAGHDEEFARWADRFDDAAARQQGTRGTLRLEQPGGMTHFAHRFDSEAELERWRDSGEYRALADEADVYSIGLAQLARGERRRARTPGEASAPKWKTWLATWVTVFPLLLALNVASEALLGGLPQPVRLGLTSLIMTAALTWIILPRVRRLLRPWLFRDGDGGLRREPG